MNLPPIEVRLQLARQAWRRGVPLYVIIEDGWARGLLYEQTLLECSAAGYGMCVAAPEIARAWAAMDEAYLKVEFQACSQVPTGFAEAV
jgi:hypothetical protein